MRSAILLAFVALYGCASAPSYRSPAVQPPASFREARDPGPESPGPSSESPHPLSPSPSGRGGTRDEPAVSSDYWDQLGDTTLSRLVGEVSRGNLDVRSAQARVSAARSDRVRSALDLTPSTTLSAGYARQRLSSASFPGASGVFPDQSVWNAGVDASWDLDLFGGIRHTVQARGALVGAAEEDLRDVQVTLTAELARAYFELRGAQEQLEVARRNAENQGHTFDLTKQRLDAGRGSAFDTERAQAQLSSTLASIPAREARVAAAQYRIGTLVGRSPTERNRVASSSRRSGTWRRASPGIGQRASRWSASRRRAPRASAPPSWRACGSARESRTFFRCWTRSERSSRRRIGWPRGGSTPLRRTPRCTRRPGGDDP